MSLKFNDPEAVERISKAIDVPFIWSHHQCVARVDSEGKIVGGIFFTDYNKASIQMHVAGFRPRWLDRELLWIAFDYPFNVLSVCKVISTIPCANKSSVAFCLKLGFTIEATIQDVFLNGGLHVASLYRNKCRFLKMPRPASITFESSYGKAVAHPR